MRRLWLARGEVELSYLDTDGEGPVVLLLHGLAGSAREFVPTAAALRDGYRVLALDQRGHGHSTRRPADTSRRAYVEDVAAVIGAVAGGPVTLVGQSMGAHTALLAACWHPGLPAALGAWFASWPRPFPSRAAAVEHLGGTPLAHAWARDLDQRADGFWPRFDPDVMQAAIAAVVQTARWPTGSATASVTWWWPPVPTSPSPARLPNRG